MMIQNNHSLGGRPILWTSPEELEAKIEAYKSYCEDSNTPFTLSGFALEIGCSRRTLLNYSRKDGFFPTIKRAKAYSESCLEERLFRNKDSRGVIFALKNNYGWQDKSEIIHTQRITISDVVSQSSNNIDKEFI